MTSKRHSNTVLFVDDELQILNSIRRATAEEPYCCLFANSGREALQAFAEHDIHVIVTDMRMPGMDGLTLLKTVREMKPEAIRIVLSGYTQLSQVLATVNQADIFQFIPKPWKMEEELLVTVQRAIENYNLKADRDMLREGLAQKNAAYQKIFQTTQQIIVNQKRDLGNLKKVNHWLFKLWKKQLQGRLKSVSERRADEEFVEQVEEMLTLYLDVLPAACTTKTVAGIVVGVTKACGGRIAINGKGKDEMELTGYYGFLAIACKSVVNIIVGAKTHIMVLCDAGVEISGSGATQLSLRFGLPSLNLSPGQLARLMFAASFLNEMGNLYGVTVAGEDEDGQISAVKIIMVSTDKQ